MTEEDQVNNLMLDMGAALAGNIPYVGGCASLTITYFKKGEDVITWQDIENYVDAKIDEALIKKDISDIQNDITSLHIDLQSYADHAEKTNGYPDSDRWSQLEIMWNSARQINYRLLRNEGYDEYEDSGVWQSCPWKVSNPASVILALNVTIVIEMINLNNRGNIEDVSGRIEEVIENILTPYNRAFQILITESYLDRMSMIRVTDTMKKHTDKYPTSQGGTKTDTYYEFNFKWHDNFNPDVGEKVNKSWKHQKDGEKVVSPLRVQLLDYQMEVHQESVDTLFNTLISPLNDFLAYDPTEGATINGPERQLRKDTGLVYRGAKVKINGYYSDSHKGSAQTTMYFSDEPRFVPVLQFSKEGNSHYNCWTFGATGLLNPEKDMATPIARFGIMRYYNKFDSDRDSQSLPLIWNESEVQKNGYIMTKTTGDAWGSGWEKSTVKWYAPLEPPAIE